MRKSQCPFGTICHVCIILQPRPDAQLLYYYGTRDLSLCPTCPLSFSLGFILSCTTKHIKLLTGHLFSIISNRASRVYGRKNGDHPK